MDRIADLERLRSDWKRTFESAWRAGDQELEETAAMQIAACDEEISRELRRIEQEDMT